MDRKKENKNKVHSLVKRKLDNWAISIYTYLTETQIVYLWSFTDSETGGDQIERSSLRYFNNTRIDWGSRVSNPFWSYGFDLELDKL